VITEEDVTKSNKRYYTWFQAAHSFSLRDYGRYGRNHWRSSTS